MFYEEQNTNKKEEYQDSLKIVGSLSNLFSDSKVPYLYYRIAEKIFCNSFLANDLSRGDVALDAVKDSTGIGLKTFLEGNKKSFQKVAEFNKDKFLYESKSPTRLVEIISKLRNERIRFSENLYGINSSIYHCVVRDENTFKLHEEMMHYVDVDNIHGVKKVKNIIKFNDGINDYSFNLSKSTLTKRFITESPLYEFDVQILANPLNDVKSCILQNNLLYSSSNRIINTIYLPLYGKNKLVYEKSALNQWNANGRVRNENEVYIPIPAKVHSKAPNFFPDRDSPFNLKLPQGDVLQVKVCQDNSKALMSFSNRELGKWILRDVLSLREGELLTYNRLQILGIDSVRIDKIDDVNYEINFASLGSFENYLESY